MHINGKDIIPSGSFMLENEMVDIREKPDFLEYLFFVVISGRYALQ